MQRVDFRMRVAGAMMVPLADDASVAHDDGADGRVWGGAADSTRGELIGALQEELVDRR